GDAPRGEGATHEAPQGGVFRRVGGQHHRKGVPALEGDAESRAEGVGIVQRAHDVLVPGERPEPEGVVAVAGRFVAEAPIDRERIVVELVAVRVELNHGGRLTKGMTNDVDLGSRYLRWERRDTTAWVT